MTTRQKEGSAEGDRLTAGTGEAGSGLSGSDDVDTISAELTAGGR